MTVHYVRCIGPYQLRVPPDELSSVLVPVSDGQPQQPRRDHQVADALDALLDLLQLHEEFIHSDLERVEVDQKRPHRRDRLYHTRDFLRPLSQPHRTKVVEEVCRHITEFDEEILVSGETISHARPALLRGYRLDDGLCCRHHIGTCHLESRYMF